MVSTSQKKAFVFEAPPEAARETVLFNAHCRRVKPSRLAPFAGYRLPLWFSSIRAEHQAVRSNAGLFDCTHMGVFTVQGAGAEDFLNHVATNDVTRLQAGKAQYSYLLDPAGAVLDDIIVYCRAAYDYLLVVNAANHAKVKAWLSGLAAGRWQIDGDQPERSLDLTPKIQDLSERGDGQALVDIALQGPSAGHILREVLDEDTDIPDSLKSFHFREVQIDDISCLLARTGYTGAKIGFELFVTRDRAEDLWEHLLEKGQGHGLVPCGLGARDTCRIEAGLPLYGHELAGEYGLSPFEAGYDWAVKLDKPFFIGKSAMQEKAQNRDGHVVRLMLPGERGIRPIRQGDAVLNESGHCIGWILSSAAVGEQQIALSYLHWRYTEAKQQIGLYYLARNESQAQAGRRREAALRDALHADLTGEIVTRFARF